MSSLQYWVETMRTMTHPGSNRRGDLLHHVAVEYLFPIIPPFTQTYLTVRPRTPGTPNRGYGSTTVFNAYCMIFFGLGFGYMIPDVFRMTFVTGGIVGYDSRLTGYQMEMGINYLYFLLESDQLVVYITNLTNANQYLEFLSQYLLVQTEEDWNILTKNLREMQFPYKIPETA